MYPTAPTWHFHTVQDWAAQKSRPLLGRENLISGLSGLIRTPEYPGSVLDCWTRINQSKYNCKPVSITWLQYQRDF